MLPNDTAPLVLQAQEGYSVQLKNAEFDSDGNATSMQAVVIGDARSPQEAHHELRGILAQQLDLLAFVTQSRFKICEILWQIDWEAGKKTLELRRFFTVDHRYPPNPELVQEYCDSVSLLHKNQIPPYLKTALKYFRLGINDTQLEDQFLRIWLALEVVAENTKDGKRIAEKCHSCQSELICATCNFAATRGQGSRSAIETLIAGITGEMAAAVSKRQFKARNSLMHGGSSVSVEEVCKIPMSKIVDELAEVTWNSIMNALDPNEEFEGCMAHNGGEFSAKFLTMNANFVFDYGGNNEYPTDEEIPFAEINMISTFSDV